MAVARDIEARGLVASVALSWEARIRPVAFLVERMWRDKYAKRLLAQFDKFLVRAGVPCKVFPVLGFVHRQGRDERDVVRKSDLGHELVRALGERREQD